MASMQNANDCLAEAMALVVDEDLDGALVSFGHAIELDPSLVRAFTGRAAVYLKLKRYTEALQDATEAIKLDPTHEMAYYRKGQASFELDEFETALAAFRKGQELQGAAGKAKSRQFPYNRWIRKCETEIEDEGEEAEDMEVVEPAAADAAAEAAVDAAVAAPAPVAAEASPPLAPQLRYQFYQSASHVTVSVMEKKLTADMVDVAIQPQALRVAVQRPGQAELVLDLALYDAVAPGESSFKVLSTKVEIKLKKTQPFQWPDLTPGAGTAVAAAAAADAGSSSSGSAPSAYSSKRDWNQVDKAMEEELTKEKPEGEEALNELFRSVYSKANEETRRAMNKSFQTSGGTVLSTNWDEVQKADYETERQAPNGMEWQTWEGKKLPMKEDN